MKARRDRFPVFRMGGRIIRGWCLLQRAKVKHHMKEIVPEAIIIGY